MINGNRYKIPTNLLWLRTSSVFVLPRIQKPKSRNSDHRGNQVLLTVNQLLISSLIQFQYARPLANSLTSKYSDTVSAWHFVGGLSRTNIRLTYRFVAMSCRDWMADIYVGFWFLIINLDYPSTSMCGRPWTTLHVLQSNVRFVMCWRKLVWSDWLCRNTPYWCAVNVLFELSGNRNV